MDDLPMTRRLSSGGGMENGIRVTIGVLIVVMFTACDSKATSQAPSKGWGVATVVPSSQTIPVSSMGAGELSQHRAREQSR